MERKLVLLSIALLTMLPVATSYSRQDSIPLIIDHTCTDLSQIPDEWIDSVQANRRLHYVHASHGAQLTCGLQRLEDSDLKYGIAVGSEYLPTEPEAFCVYDKEGDPKDYWYGDEWKKGTEITRQILNGNPTINTSMFCWCFQMELEGSAYVEEYLDSLSMLEGEFPNVTFVYMTGNAQIDGSAGYNRYLRNEQIRNHCLSSNKVLFDFADLDSWWFNPSSQEWEQATYWFGGHDIPIEHPNHFGNDCGHTSWESCEQKGRAVWWMMAQLGGSNSVTPGDFIRGDGNADMQIQMADATYILRYLYVPGSPSLLCTDAADADDSGTVLLSDVTYLLKYLYIPEAPEPPTPFPACGPDPTTDGVGCNWHPCEPVE